MYGQYQFDTQPPLIIIYPSQNVHLHISMQERHFGLDCRLSSLVHLKRTTSRPAIHLNLTIHMNLTTPALYCIQLHTIAALLLDIYPAFIFVLDETPIAHTTTYIHLQLQTPSLFD